MKQETQQQTASTTTSQKVVSQQAQKSSASAIDKLKEFGGFAFLENIIEVAAGSNHNLALAKDGTVWTWGYNYHGQLGNGTTANSSLPVKVKIGGGSVDLQEWSQ